MVLQDNIILSYRIMSYLHSKEILKISVMRKHFDSLIADVFLFPMMYAICDYWCNDFLIYYWNYKNNSWCNYYRCLMDKNFVRIGKWFVRPYEKDEKPVNKRWVFRMLLVFLVAFAWPQLSLGTRWVGEAAYLFTF